MLVCTFYTLFFHLPSLISSVFVDDLLNFLNSCEVPNFEEFEPSDLNNGRSLVQKAKYFFEDELSEHKGEFSNLGDSEKESNR